MNNLYLDIETYSGKDLAKTGVYTYAESTDFEILLFGYATDDAPVKVVDLTAGEEIPQEIIDALSDQAVIKHVWNASFERICLSRHLGVKLSPKGWHCTMVHAAALGLPLALKDTSRILTPDTEKLESGKSLIRYFCTPNKAKLKNLPQNDRQRWREFIAYNRRDVEAERAIAIKIAKFPLPESVWRQYYLDQEINDRGVKVDLTLAQHAISADSTHRERCLLRAQALTGLQNPNSPLQLKDWLAHHGCALESLMKTEVEEALATATGEVKEVLTLRQELSKSSVKKYQAMTEVTGRDGRARGLMQFYGANRTGRWAGRLIQVQNLPRNTLPDISLARDLIRKGCAESVPLLFDSLPDTLSQLIRTAFIPSEGSRFIVADFSAIEARVIAWLAGESWVLKAFREGKDIYCESATQMFGVPVEKHGANAELRQKGKAACLACGYQGSVGALKAMGADKLGMSETDMQTLVDRWREANPNIVKFWYDVEQAAKTAITECATTRVGKTIFQKRSGILFITLPSGRSLAYVKPQIGENRFGMPSITYWGSKVGEPWVKLETYGGKLSENITQAVARDLFAHAMGKLEEAGYKIVMHIHDEVVCDMPYAQGSLTEACQIMSISPTWAADLPLRADGFECSFYQKD